jgi:hypothetical protein
VVGILYDIKALNLFFRTLFEIDKRKGAGEHEIRIEK